MKKSLFPLLLLCLLLFSACSSNTYSTINETFSLKQISHKAVVDPEFREHFKIEIDLWKKILWQKDWNQYVFYTPEGQGIETLNIEKTKETDGKMSLHLVSPSLNTTLEVEAKTQEEIFYNYGNILQVTAELDSHFDYLNEKYQKEEISTKNIGMARGRKDFYEKVFAKCSSYLASAKETFEKIPLPPEMARLVLLESGCEPASTSSKSAAGIWQMIPETAQKYGLIVNDTLDERFDPALETQAASRYLSELLLEFQHPLWAMNAYHSGEGNLRKAKDWVQEHYPNVSVEEKFIHVVDEFADDTAHNTEDIYFYGSNSSRYTILFTAVSELYDDYLKNNKDASEASSWWNTFANRKTYTIKLPEEAITSAYTVQSGDTLISIARNFFLTLESLQIQVNRDPKSLHAGEILQFEHPYFEELGKTLEKANRSIIIADKENFCRLNPSIVKCIEKDPATLLLPTGVEVYY